MKVACVQFEPVHGDTTASLAKAEELVAKKLGDHTNTNTMVDLLIFPEMAFTGYLFRNPEHIFPLAECVDGDVDEGSCETFTWCSRIARKYKCGVCAGFPRKERNNNNDPKGNGNGNEKSIPKLFNSMMVVDPDGALLCVYDKHHLYEADEKWACEGYRFKEINLNWLKRKNGDPVRAGLGICMDINPKGFKAPWRDFELARHHKAKDVDLILFCSAWCKHPDDLNQNPDSMETMKYWCSRLEPLISTKTFFCVADRVGTEPNDNLVRNKGGVTRFCGSSCVIDLNTPFLKGFLDAYEENILICDLEL
mmetsp:Transcript_15264/g.18872  ORF Transcript_15264/g.18872 Transcript_15264/m.18872 type:complete len:308 (+) Transcript_15264:39-962(+)